MSLLSLKIHIQSCLLMVDLIALVEEVKSVVNQGVTEIKQESTQAKPKTDAKINTIGSKEDGLIASKFREDLKSFFNKD